MAVWQRANELEEALRDLLLAVTGEVEDVQSVALEEAIERALALLREGEAPGPSND